VQSRFKAAIRDPLHDLSSTQPATTQFIAKMKSMHPSLWFKMVGDLNKFNMAMEMPTITSISPPSGPAAGGQPTTITGTAFVAGQTQIKFVGPTANPPVSALVVVDGATVTLNGPACAAGKYDVVVTTPAGSATLPQAYVST
jgi:hypothetical protein